MPIMKVLLHMRALFSVFSIFLLLMSCQPNKHQQKLKIAENYHVFGDTIIVSNSIEVADAYQLFNNLVIGDTISTIITAMVTDVCKKKGCWIKLDLKEDREVMVRFKDYGFFVPEDIIGKEVILQGNAFVDQVSVEDQQHYAMDAGKNEMEIAAITQPKNTYTFLASGVLTKK